MRPSGFSYIQFWEKYICIYREEQYRDASFVEDAVFLQAGKEAGFFRIAYLVMTGMLMIPAAS